MQEMCNLGEALEMYGVETGKVKLIMSAMNKNGWDVEKTMDFMDVDMKDRPKLAERVREEQAKKA